MIEEKYVLLDTSSASETFWENSLTKCIKSGKKHKSFSTAIPFFWNVS